MKLTKEEQYKLALFMIVRNSKVLPQGLNKGKTMKEINKMTIDTCSELMNTIDFEKAKMEYEHGSN